MRTLREINFKTTMKLEDAYLRMRREKETRLREHFIGHMNDLKELERQEAAESEKKAHSPSGKYTQHIPSQKGRSLSVNTASSVASEAGSVGSAGTAGTANGTARGNHSFSARSPARSQPGGGGGSFRESGILHGSARSPGEDGGSSMYSGSFRREGSSSSVRTMSPKAKKLMTKTATGRQTAFLVDSLPPNLKRANTKSSDYNPNGSTASLVSSTATSSPTHSHHAYPHFPNVTALTASARISAFAQSEMFDPRSPSSRMQGARNHGTPGGAGGVGNHHHHHHHHHQYATTGTASALTAGSAATTGTGTTAAAGNAAQQVLSNPHYHTTRNVVGTTAARGRNSVTFFLDTHSAAGAGGDSSAPGSREGRAGQASLAPAVDRTLVGSLTLGVKQAARLAAQAVAALPDYDANAAKREEELHLNPRRLLLDNARSLHQYDTLSAGEQVLAMHKTFHHIGDLLSVSTCC